MDKDLIIKGKRAYSLIVNKYDDFLFESLEEIMFQKSSIANNRINILLPTIKKEYVYGGIKTALDFFLKFHVKHKFEARIIVLSDFFDKSIIKSITEYKFVNCNDDSVEDEITYCFVRDNNGKMEHLSVRENDLFIGTTWQSMYCFKNYDISYESFFGHKKDVIYLIQDYEPGFYRWSSEFLLADSTYRQNNIIAVFNSVELKDYMMNHGYCFKKYYYFSPSLNEKLASKLKSVAGKKIIKENIVLIYGRPNIYRNAFTLIAKALTMLTKKYKIDSSWKFYSVGKKHRDIELPNGFKIESKGKLSIEDYGDLLLKSKVGISLMCSPHPSYPPLEMATFGINTITNCFENKNMSYFSKNIVSLNSTDFDTLCAATIACMNKHDGEIELDSNYVNGNSKIDGIVDEIVVTALY